MDGSMGRMLAVNGMPQDDLFRKIWSARALVDEKFHRMVVAGHRSYLDAGATLLTTNAYGVQPHFYRRAFPDDWQERMLKDAELASKLAVQARQESGSESTRIFGCLPPICESHRPDLFREFLAKEGEDFVVRTYRTLAEAALRGGADALMLENMVSWEEAALALRGCKDLGASLILSMEGALRDMELQPQTQRAPEVARHVLAAKRGGAPIEALGFSCTEPETILECLKAIEDAEGLSQELRDAGVRLSAHANCNDRRQAHAKGFDVTKDKSKEIKVRHDLVDDGFTGYVQLCADFVKHGASYVGGCCGCGPEGIEAMSAQFRKGKNARKRRGRDIVNWSEDDLATARKALAPTGVLRAGINLANTLLVARGASSALEGVSPELAAEVARRLGVELRCVPFGTPGEVADASESDAWDIALIGADPKRAEKIAFSAPYAEAPATYVVSAGSELKRVTDVDKAGVRVATMTGTAYDLWLKRNLKHAELVPAADVDACFTLLKGKQVDAAAGLRQHLLDRVGTVPGAAILDGQFMSAQQAIGISRKRGPAAEAFLKRCVDEAKASGFVATLLEKHAVQEQLVVPPPIAGSDEAEMNGGAAKRRCVDAGIAAARPGGMKICVLGCGAMGSVYAGLLASGGHEVWAVDVWKEHIDAIRERGLRVEGPNGDRTTSVNATIDAAEVGPCDLVIIATKASGVGAAARTAKTLVKADGAILTIQNGLGAGDRIAEHIDTDKVMLGIASNFGASMRGPGHAEHKSMNLICIGEMSGGNSERLERVVNAWSGAGFKTKACPDIHAMIWDKLVCNCTFSGPCAMTGFTVGEVLDCPEAWSVALSCAQEAHAVGLAKGIAFSFTDVEEHVRKFGSTVRGARPSLAQDLMARRRSEIDAINGAVPVEAEKVGLTAPVNRTVANLVRARESTFEPRPMAP